MERALRNYLPEGTFEGTTAKRSKMMQAVRGKDNRTTERRLRLALVRSAARGWKVRPRGLKGSPDLFFPAQKIAVFVDGCFWHGCPNCGHLPRTNSLFWAVKIRRNRERDSRTTIELQQQGIRVLRFWEHELRINLEGCIKAIRIAQGDPKNDRAGDRNGLSAL